MKAPSSVKKANDILYTPGNIELNRDNIQAIIDNYCPDDGQIRVIKFDGGPLGAWVNVSINSEYQWLYIAAGDHDNRLAVAQAASL